jgi:uncharacterized membrane protein required for colicin V production
MFSLLGAAWQYYALDGVVILLLLIVGLRDGKKGFIECLFSLASVLVATALAFAFMNLVLESTGGLFGLQEILEEACVKAFSGIKGFDMDVSNEGIAASLADKNIPNFLIDAVIEEYGNADIAPGTTIALLVGTSLGEIIAGLLAWVAIFLVVKLVLHIIKRFLVAIIRKISLIKKLDCLLGFFVGLIKGVLLISAVLAVISLIPSIGLGEFFNETIFVGWLYNHNPINEILSWILI